MRVVVFGATGGLGQWTLKAAMASGHEVVAFARSPDKLGPMPASAQVEVFQGDVTNPDAVRTASEGCEVAINCTSPAGGNSTLELAQAIVGQASADVLAFYMVGGLGALWAPGTERQVLVQDWDDAEALGQSGLSGSMPREVIRNMTRGHLQSMAWMAARGVPHTFLCPGRMIDAGPSEGRRVSLDELGEGRVTEVHMGDVAQTIVDDLPRGALLGHRVCILSQ
ncbi:MAG: NAD(P)-dependent oxidoreductase [Sandaracinaceae bacterium]